MIRLTTFMIFMLIGSCTGETGNSASVTTDTANTSMMAVSEQPVLADTADTPPSEIDPSVDRSMDSMAVKVGLFIKKVYGYRDGKFFIVEGDISIPVTDSQKLNQKGGGITNQLWPVSGGYITIPYSIKEEFLKTVVESGMKMWEDAVKIRFRPSTAADKSYITFKVWGSTNSSLGRQSIAQNINLQSNVRPGNVAHEIGHALGLVHEQSRRDSRNYVEISENCLDNPNYAFGYLLNPTAEDFMDYNYYSIMHYRFDDCLKQKGNLKLRAGVPGQRDSVTVTDVQAIRIMYKL